MTSSTFSPRMRMIGALAATALAFAAAGCSKKPATGREDLSFMSPAEEQRIGDENHPKIIEEYGGVYSDPKVGGYFALVASRLVRATGRQDIGLPELFALPV